MENKKNTLRLEYLPLKDALELYKQGIFVKGVFPSDSLGEDLDGIDQDLKEKFLAYYCPNLQSGLFEYDMSIEDYEPELANVQMYDDTVEIKDVFSDELGYGIETEDSSIINCDSRLVYKNREAYENKKRGILAKAKDMSKTVGSVFAAPFTRYVTMKAKNVPDIDNVLQGGIYHFTSEKAADAILKSGYIKPSGRVTSYSTKKKTFFFGENPELQDVLYNCKDLQKHMTAIHVKYNEALQRDIKNGKVQVRLDDGAICIVGATKKEHGYEMEKVQMELVKDENTNTFYYKNVSEKELTDSEIATSKEVDERLKGYLKIPKALRELVTYPEVAKRAVSRFANALTGKTTALPEKTEQTDVITDSNMSKMYDNLHNNVYSEENINENYDSIGQNVQREQQYEKTEV